MLTANHDDALVSATLCKGEYIPGLPPAKIANLSRCYLELRELAEKLRAQVERPGLSVPLPWEGRNGE
jgi:hypothetical protein